MDAHSETTEAPIDLRQVAVADDLAVNRFACAMMQKMALSRAKGRGGWQTCPVDVLWDMLREHVAKGDPVDVANLAMMIHENSQRAERARLLAAAEEGLHL